MGKLIPGPYGVQLGKIGNTVTYIRMGEIITRTIGTVTSWSPLQDEVQMRMKLIGEFLKPVKDFIDIGFEHAAKPKKTWSNHNLAVSLNNPHAIKGMFPNLEINYEKLVLSKGVIPVPKNLKTSLDNHTITFTWDADLQTEGTDEDDQVMCLVYFPENKQVFKILSGAKRGAQKQTVTLPLFSGDMVVETFMCFISDDRKKVSDTVYSGQLLWNDDVLPASEEEQGALVVEKEQGLYVEGLMPQAEILPFVTEAIKQKVFHHTIESLFSKPLPAGMYGLGSGFVFNADHPVWNKLY